VVHEPILRLRIAQALERHVGRVDAGSPRQERGSECRQNSHRFHFMVSSLSDTGHAMIDYIIIGKTHQW
jgi:hypothetical protein